LPPLEGLAKLLGKMKFNVLHALLITLAVGCASKPYFFQTQEERDEAYANSPEAKRREEIRANQLYHQTNSIVFEIEEFKSLTGRMQQIAENSAKANAKMDAMGVPGGREVIDDMTDWIIRNYASNGAAWLVMRKYYLDKNPEPLPTALVDEISKGVLMLGMSREQVFLAWALTPEKITKSVDASGQLERCVYDFHRINAESPENSATASLDNARIRYPPATAKAYYLDFVNGVLKRWQESK
jgi:hypothetical protein